MSEYAVMPMTDYEGICNAVRAKTGGTAKLKSSEVKQEIEGIQTGSDPVVQPLTVTENGTYSAPSGVDGYNPVTVNVAGSAPIENGVVYTAVNDAVRHAVFYGTEVRNYALKGDQNIHSAYLPDAIEKIGIEAFYTCTGLRTLTSKEYTSAGDGNIVLPPNLIAVFDNAFFNCMKFKQVTFLKKPTLIKDSAFTNCTNLLTINVPWAEGEVANAPWGATNATINYNYTGG